MMTDAGISLSTGGLTLVLLVVALGIFAWLAVKSRSVRSFQFQLSLFIVIWIAGEIVDLLHEQYTMLLPYHNAGLYVHVLAMGLFSAMLWTRFYLSRKSGKKMADSMQEG
jgi:hydrogenase/urease accessory protein HupE